MTAAPGIAPTTATTCRPTSVFVPERADAYTGHWLDVDISTPARVTAYDGDQQVNSFLTIIGAGPRPTPTGVFTILRRVANETMNSDTIGIPRFGPGGYYLTNVLFTQYFTDDGASLHYNYWSSNWGYPGSHGCLGLTLPEQLVAVGVGRHRHAGRDSPVRSFRRVPTGSSLCQAITARSG